MLFCSNYAKNFASTIRRGLYAPIPVAKRRALVTQILSAVLTGQGNLSSRGMGNRRHLVFGWFSFFKIQISFSYWLLCIQVEFSTQRYGNVVTTLSTLSFPWIKLISFHLIDRFLASDMLFLFQSNNGPSPVTVAPVFCFFLRNLGNHFSKKYSLVKARPERVEVGK